ncbi:MAG: hypothetical protein J6U56_08660 [Spirochaetia bacterium]|nr:hypothetical protein [Spirochaetia bacterium]
MNKTRVRSRILIILMFCALAGLLVFNIVTLQTVRKLSASAKETAAAVGNLDFTLQNMGEDLSDARNVLGLKINSYGSDLPQETPEAPADDYAGYYSALDHLMSEFSESMLRKGCSYFMESKECLDLYRTFNLTPVQKGRDILLSSGTKLYYRLSILPYTTGGKVQFDAETFDKVSTARISAERELASFIDANNSRIQAHYAQLEPVAKKMDQFSRNQQLLSYLSKQKLYIKKRDAEATQTGYDIRRGDGSLLCSMILDHVEGNITLGNIKCSSADDLWENLLKLHTLFDIRTVSEKKTESKLEELSAMVKDPAFTAFLETKGCTIAQTPVENPESYDFAITDRGGFKIGTLSLEKDSGEVYLFDSDNVVVSSVKKN